jgi:hypothetical protein
VLKWNEYGGSFGFRKKSEPAVVWRDLPDNEPPADHPPESIRAIKGFWVHSGEEDYVKVYR